MERVDQLLKKKGHQVWSISPDASVYEAIELMSIREIGSLMVMKGTALLGVLSERDYARNVILKGRSSRDTRVGDIITTKFVYARPDQTVEQCMEIMTEKRVRHLPVLDGDRLVGVVSIGDLVKAVISEQQFMIRQLEQYISG